jgi:hypothetical protein
LLGGPEMTSKISSLGSSARLTIRAVTSHDILRRG